MLHRPWSFFLDVCLPARIAAFFVALLLPSAATGQTTVTVSRPNGGERVYTSTPYTIEWIASDSAGAIRSFDVLVSANSGATYTAVAGCTGLGPAVRSCTWTAPAPVTTTGRVRVVAHTSASDVVDASNTNFTVVSGAGRITVTAPNTATAFFMGSPRLVSWTHTLGAQAHVRVDLSRDGGSSWESIAADVTSGTSSGSFNWTVKGPATTAARVRVAALNTTTSDASDVAFAIVAPTLRITEQPAGTNWGYGTQQRITWTTNLSSADRLNLKLSTDGGLTFPLTLASQVTASAGAATVTIPVLGAQTSNAVLLAELVADTSVRSATLLPLTIEAPFISVIRPNLAGDTWPIGASRTVSWRDNLGALERVRLELSRDGGITYPTSLAGSTPADGSHAVTVSSAWATATARIRVAWVRNLNIRDASDQDFAIRTGATNVAPVANAGADQTASPGTLVRLDGSASRDGDGNTLTYLWTLITRPAGSAAVLAPATAIAPAFVADVAGQYTARLVVSDGVVNSPADSVTVVAMANAPPTADAGPDVLVNRGTTVSLDGTASRDPEGGALSFAWTIVERPEGSAAVLTNAAGPAPSLVADVGGRYVVRLVVSDGVHTSQPDTVSVTANTPPVANAGPDQTPVVGATVSLSGAASADVDGQALTYAWSIQSRPSGRTAALSDAAAVDPTFVVDRAGGYVIRLVVSDGMATSQPATVTVNTSNSAPVAVAGADQSARVTDVVTLDASNSTDVDGDTLRFTWTLARPSGSTATLSNPSLLNPTFTLDKAGTYVATLTVSDGVANSDPDTVTITTLNSAPVANAGDNTSARVQETVVLDGTGSVDVDGDLLSFSWALTTVPEGSAAALDQPEAPRPRFVLDRPGTYVAQLIVHDGTVASAADTITVTTSNSAPLAHAGEDQTVYVNTTVLVDGSASFDADFDPLQYTWAITSRPATSKAVLTAADAPAPSFVVDAAGTYVLQLIVSDNTVESAPDTVVVTTMNSVPVARAGEDQTVAPGATVQLSGADSIDADADPLAYSWALVTVPEGSAAALSDASVADPSFVADLPGTYVAQLIVNDGRANSPPDTAAITVHKVNLVPAAAAGADQSVNTGVTVQLNGTESSDPDGDSLTFAWVMTSAPADSTAALSDPASAAPQFVPDQPGEYVFALTVSDGRATSLADSVRVTVVLPPEFIGTIAASPATLRFSAMAGQAAPPSQTFTVTLGDTIEPASWVASYSAPWLSVSPPTGSGSLDVSVTINAAGLAPGTYQHTVQIEGPRLQGSPAAVTVHLVVDPPWSQPTNPEPQTILVPLGGNIQAAIDAAAPGSTILLQPGTYVTNLVLPAKQNPDGKYITITTAEAVLPEGRIDAALKPSLAIIRSPTAISAVRTNARASYYRLLGLAFEANKNAEGEVIALGHATSQITPEQVPHHIELDRIIIVGGTVGQKRGIALNAADVLIQNSDFSNIWRNGQESQAIAGWNTPGRITIRNNRLEAASENIMFGGSDPAIPNLVPADILIEDNLSTKNLAWRGDSTKVVKNAFELKAARRVTVRGNIFERVWNQGQDGTAILIKSVNSSGKCTACVSEDILFENNIVRSAGAAFNVSGYHINYPSGQTRGITIRNNLFYDISTSWGGNGRLMTLGNEPADIVVEGNTIIANGTSIIYIYTGTKMLSDGSKVAGGPLTGFVYTNNLAKHSSYGFFTPAGHSAKDHASWLPGATIAHNVFAGAATTKYYPATNLFPTVAEFTAQFADPANHDYVLVEGSPYWTAGVGGKRLGVDHSALPPR